MTMHQDARIRRRAFLLLVLSTAAFARQAAYEVAPDAPSATLTVRNDSDTRMVVRVFRNAGDCSGGKLVFGGAAVTPPAGEASGPVAAGAPLSMFVEGTDNVYTSCLFPFTFEPKPGARYVARLVLDRTTGVCHFGLGLATASDVVSETTYRPRRWRAPFLESGAFCKAEK